MGFLYGPRPNQSWGGSGAGTKEGSKEVTLEGHILCLGFFAGTSPAR